MFCLLSHLADDEYRKLYYLADNDSEETIHLAGDDVDKRWASRDWNQLHHAFSPTLYKWHIVFNKVCTMPRLMYNVANM